MSGANLIAPPHFSRKNLPEWRNVLHRAHGADTLFWMQGASRPEMPLFLTSLARGRARRSAYVIDAWKNLHLKIGMLAILQRLDPCFVAFREACEELKKRFPSGRFEWLPFGVDTTVFDATPGERPIFGYSMGRRYEPLHQALLRYCTDRGLEYRYTSNGEIRDPVDLGKMVARSKYFLVTPPDLPSPARTQGYSPFVMRYLEGLSAGSRLLGVLPASGEYEMLLPLDAMLQVSPDGSDLAVKLDADRGNPEVGPAVERARLMVRAKHSWSKRAEQVFTRLSTGEPITFESFLGWEQSSRRA